jgi:hypothetical protein
MDTNTSRGPVAFVAAPVTAACLFASALGFANVAHAGVTSGVNVRASGMTLSREYVAQQKEEHGKSATPMERQSEQQNKQPGSPGKQEASELSGDIKAEEVKEVALHTVESRANVQTPEPKSHVYELKNPIHKHLGMMKAGFSQVAR